MCKYAFPPVGRAGKRAIYLPLVASKKQIYERQ